MSGAFVTSELEGLVSIMTTLNRVGDQRRLGEGLAYVGGLVVSQTQRRLAEDKSSPDGDAWAAWSPGYAETRKKGSKLLEASGALITSMAWDVTSDELRVGTNLVYAALHQFGGTDDMAPGPAAVPARPFLGVSPDDAADIEDAMGDWLSTVLQ